MAMTENESNNPEINQCLIPTLNGLSSFLFSIVNLNTALLIDNEKIGNKNDAVLITSSDNPYSSEVKYEVYTGIKKNPIILGITYIKENKAIFFINLLLAAIWVVT